MKITCGPANAGTNEERYETYSHQQIRVLISTAAAEGDVQIAQMIVVLAETGMRFGELQFLSPTDLDWRKGSIRIGMKKISAPLHPEMERLLDRNGRWWPKDETDRYVMMTPTVYRVLEELAPTGSDRPWVFVNEMGLPVQDQGTRERLQRYATRAGIMPVTSDRGKHAGEVWSRKEREEYTHKAPKRVAETLAEAIARHPRNGDLFTAEELFPLKDQEDGGDVPGYQGYVALAWLRTVGLVEQHGRSGYTAPNAAGLGEAMRAEWDNLSEQTV